MCDSCGYEWEIEDADVVKIPNEKVLAMRELSMLTDNKIRHLKKDAMVALAYDLGVTNACGKTKTYLANLLISIKNGEIKC